jgi:hypothetical protein
VWRVVWFFVVESDRDRDADDRRAWGTLLRWAVVGLAVLGVAAVIAVRLATG